jgi:NADH dehydrogenase
MKDGSRQQIEFDHLLVGLGSTDRSTIQGINPFGFRLKSQDEFLRTRESIQIVVEEAARMKDPQAAAEKLSFVVGGGGFAGVELVANLAEFINSYKNSFPSLRDIRPAFRLVHSGCQILECLGKGLSQMRDYAERTLANYGIDIILNARIKEISADGVLLEDGRFIQCSMAISTIGQQPRGLKGLEELKKDHLHRIYTNSFLQLTGCNNIWGGGDACHVLHPERHTACPTNALWAIKHGNHIGKNIARAIMHKKLQPFRYRGLGQCASLGIGKGMGEIHGIVLTGWISWIIRWIFFAHFMPSRNVMWKVARDWLHLLLKGARIDLPLAAQLAIEKKKNLQQSKIIPLSIL